MDRLEPNATTSHSWVEYSTYHICRSFDRVKLGSQKASTYQEERSFSSSGAMSEQFVSIGIGNVCKSFNYRILRHYESRHGLPEQKIRPKEEDA
eukprot:scaffold7824_cov76-Amphora_coffeaeformis.AAC.1